MTVVEATPAGGSAPSARAIGVAIASAKQVRGATSAARGARGSRSSLEQPSRREKRYAEDEEPDHVPGQRVRCIYVDAMVLKGPVGENAIEDVPDSAPEQRVRK